MDAQKPALLFQRIAEKLEKLIRSDTLRPGDRIPSVRRACKQHGVSVATVIRAYRSLEDRGLIEARSKSGYFVRSRFRDHCKEPQMSQPKLAATAVDVSDLQTKFFAATRIPDIVPSDAGYPSADNLPTVKLSRIMASVARNAGARGMDYEMPPGSEPLRREIAKRSLDWRLNLFSENIITTCGGSE